MRGLIAQLRGKEKENGRELVTNRQLVRWVSGQKSQRGTCVWCERACDKARAWHTLCVRSYLCARGQTFDLYKDPLVKYGPCEICGGPGDEIDHRLAICVAVREGRRATLRAFWLDNLRWLCRACHRTKTRRDRKVVRFQDVGSEQLELF